MKSFFAFVVLLLAGSGVASAQPIDREALVKRHNPIVRKVDVDSPLTVGNGGFAFGVDITGLQTFADHYQRWGIPTETLSRWAWVTDENTHGYTLADAGKDFTLADDRVMSFPTRSSVPAGDWLRKNPRNHPLGQLALEWKKDDGSAFTPEDIQSPEQTLDLWTGLIKSRFKLGGVPVVIITACASDTDTLAVRIESELVTQGKLSARLTFPRGHNLSVKNTPNLDWSSPESHTSSLHDQTRIDREILGTHYYVASSRPLTETAPHTFSIKADARASALEFTLQFSPQPITAHASDAEKVRNASKNYWEKFWRESAAVDFNGSADPRANDLEKRIILSRYLMAVQMAGDVPPQESGLTCSTWYGKHHSEMIWWHTAHFALWGNDALLEKNLAWFQSQLPAARELAKSRGLKGARWAKMTGPDMRESPGGNPLIVWNQPHMIYLAELLYRNQPNAATLAKYRELVFETADCLATMVHFDAKSGTYVLGPPLWIAQEIYDQATSQNPSFELAYWRWTLGVAQQWRERLGLPRDEKWDHVITHLAPIPQKDGKYVALGSNPDTFDNIDSRHDHPTMLAPLGVLPEAPGVDRATMERTLDAVLKTWDWETKIWGWDYPMIAMTAARLNRPEVAVEILLRNGPNNLYLPNGHCPQRSDEKFDPKKPHDRKREIAVYLPANGSFLAAVALMVGGWDGAEGKFPGIPKDGKWKVRAEGLKPMP
ncbi:hypothetical protein [Oleiharenicola lentus]|uniref:hypothetical protein n=1 Tax=Oleiharenicola lentus TaxID=2508720 RepID=UPI003F6679C3